MGETVVGVELSPDGGGFSVCLRIEGEKEGPVPFVLDRAQGSRTMNAIEALETGSLGPDSLRDIGATLSDALLPGALGTRFRKALDNMGRVTLELTIPDALVSLPWETLFDQKLRCYVACHPRINVVHVGGDAARRPARPSGDRASILVVIPQGAELNAETEWANLSNAVAKLQDAAEIHPLRGAVHPSKLSEKLRERHWNVVHFIGHGRIVDGRVEVRINDEAGEELWRSAEEFTPLFMETSVDVCVLNCCHGGSATHVAALDRLAPGLLAAGARAVVAMRYAMGDTDAILFSRAFYSELLRGETAGRVGIAAQLARKSLLESTSRDRKRAFVTPVVHLAGHEQALFEIRRRPAQPPVTGDAAPLQLPPRLHDAIVERRCVVVVGLDLVPPPADRRTPGPPGLRTLIEALKSGVTGLRDLENERPGLLEDVAASEWLRPEDLLRRFADRCVASDEPAQLLEGVRRFYAPQPPSELHGLIARWRAPAIFYTHFDGLMEAAHETLTHRTIRNLSEGFEPSDALLVLVRGSIDDYGSLVLSEHDHFELTERIEHMHLSLSSLAKPRPNQLRCVVFLGTSPADPVTRQLGRKLLSGERPPEAFFVSNNHSSDDEWFWRRLKVRFVYADTEAVVRAASAPRVGR
jgi:CHAT domain-containing protein/SIR2-like protein